MRLLAFTLLAFAFHASAAEAISPGPTPEQEQSYLKEVKVPEGFEAKIFAVPPAVNYPVFVSAAPDGTLYVSSDKNGSLDRAAHRGRVLRVRDLDGDGHADEVKAFVPDVDSPRGLVWDRDRLYLLHPPNLSVYIDHDGDGVADEEKVLVRGIAFTFKDRPADHSSNGIELGVDGWIYCAIGDFGFMQAEGADGTKMQLRGGGVVRVRPDGSGLELYSRGTRNILEAAVSPTLDVFARDNTNDGDGWDIRVHHFTGLSDHGYPSLFKHFKGEFIEPLADYGGGAGCGALFLSEPGFPEGYNDAFYSADWGREWVYRHHVTPDGATFQIDKSEFVRAPRVTDLDVDAMSRIYVASWKGATFTYVGENVGFLVRLAPKGYTPETLPDFGRASDADLLRALESPSHRRRLAAQRELLSRRFSPEIGSGAKRLAANSQKPLASRIAALFLLKQALGAESHPFLVELMNDASIRQYALRAVCDRPDQNENASIGRAEILAALKDPNPRVRWEAAYGLTRWDDRKDAGAISVLLGDPDPTVAHTAMQALRKLDAPEVCFAALDSSGSSEAERTGAVHVLQRLHEAGVVDGLIQRLNVPQDLLHRRQLLTALCRLYYTDGEWKGDSWGTRPDTSGPYYQPAEWTETSKISEALKNELKKATGEDATFLVTEFGRHKIQDDETLATVVDLAEKDRSLVPTALAQLARAEKIPDEGLKVLIPAAKSADTPPLARAHAVMALAKVTSAESTRAMLAAMPDIYGGRDGGREMSEARQAFLRSRKPALVDTYKAEAAALDPKTSPWADALLVAIANDKNSSPEARESATHAIDDGWKEPKRKAQILRAIAFSESRASRERVLDSMDDPDPDVKEAARFAARALRLDRELQNKQKNAVLVGSLTTEDVVNRAMNLHGSVKLGEELFTRQSCNTCHTVKADEPLRGPFLGAVASLYKRDELATAILLPNKTIAQGFTTHHFELKDGTEAEGFVVQEAADKVTIRNVLAQEIQIKTSDIARRTKLEKSIMPEGLAANLSMAEFSSLLDYLQSLAKQ
ncbi:MAG TPA: PVC-type heme-binding CxxCH protein [Verrucomicrobiae bacterium]|nr:PVC-type heme-binding CxxCH protein [Verrucomicrobiae bacterium]